MVPADLPNSMFEQGSPGMIARKSLRSIRRIYPRVGLSWKEIEPREGLTRKMAHR